MLLPYLLALGPLRKSNPLPLPTPTPAILGSKLVPLGVFQAL